MTPELHQISEIARAAGQRLLRHSGRVDPQAKSDHSWVTVADRESEALISERLAAACPTDRMIGEETGAAAADAAGRVWLVDPLDGTTNFVHELPLWCVALGLMTDGQPTLGVIYDPLRDLCYAGQPGVGCWCNDRALTLPPRDAAMSRNDLVGVLSPRVAEQAEFGVQVRYRILGSAQLQFAQVAAGAMRVGLWHRGFGWDLLAGAALVLAAGGVVVTVDGEPPDYAELVDRQVQRRTWLATDAGTLPTALRAARALRSRR